MGGGSLSGTRVDTMELITVTGERCQNHGLPSFLDDGRNNAQMYYSDGHLFLLGGKGNTASITEGDISKKKNLWHNSNW